MKRKTTLQLQSMKSREEKISMVTAYDATMSRLVELAGIDIILVGDSAGMVMQGRSDTLAVSIDEIIYHCQCVGRGNTTAHLVGDMPFMSYQTSLEEGLRNAGRLVKEGGCQSVKIEGAGRHLPLVEALVDTGIPVMGHIGLTPQSVNKFGGFKVQGRDSDGLERLLAEAKGLEKAGAYSIVLEGIPASIAARISTELHIPTIGIGAGKTCDGQVLVIQDLLGMNSSFKPKFVRLFAELEATIVEALKDYDSAVKSGSFPSEEESFGLTKKSSPSPVYSTPGKK